MQRIKTLFPYLLAYCLLTLISCDQIEKSIQDTKRPVPANFGSNSITSSNYSSSSTKVTTSPETTTALIKAYFEQHKSGTAIIDDSALMQIIEMQLKSSGSEPNNETMLELIRKRTKFIKSIH